MKAFLKILAAIVLCTPSLAFAQDPEPVDPYVAPRELVILKAGADQLWGTWVVAVMNRGTSAKEFSFQANLPREVVDFQPGEGLTAKDLNLKDEGLFVEKAFAPGVNVVSLTFSVPAQGGKASLTLVPVRSLPELILMSPSGLLEVHSEQMKFMETNNQDGQRYDVHTLKQPVEAGTSVVFQLKGIPEGRSRLWWTGGIFGLILLAMTGFLAWKTRPQNSGDLEGVNV